MPAVPDRPRLILANPPDDAPEHLDSAPSAPAEAPPPAAEATPRKPIAKREERALIARLLEAESGPLLELLLEAIRQAHDGPRLVSKSALAKRLDVSPRTIERMDAGGLIPAPAVRRDQFVRWSLDSIARWIALGCPTRSKFEEHERMQLRGRAGRQPHQR